MLKIHSSEMPILAVLRKSEPAPAVVPRRWTTDQNQKESVERAVAGLREQKRAEAKSQLRDK
jgi:hypothetical protein